MAEIKVVPLGAGQDVGRSCILVSLGGKNVMLDCGMHMGFNDERRFPDFSYITESGRSLTEHIDCLIISHFHLDHCGALPYFTEICGYNGPILMTHPTKAISPILLEDYRKIAVERKGEQNFFTSQMIKDCMKKVTTINLHQTIKMDSTLEVKAYYAGHVLGAVMVLVKVGSQSFVYTGDYNMTPDRHLGSAWIDKCQPDLLITESTYATTIRDSKRCRERDFLKKISECLERNGKVLIPVFALGRAQELCILLETFWDRMNLKYPVYFSQGLAEKANHYYKLFITWTNQKIRSTFVQRNMFEFKHIKPFDRSYIDQPGPMVVFATPGMLHAGLSLQIFKKWAEDEKNMLSKFLAIAGGAASASLKRLNKNLTNTLYRLQLIMPGYCVAGTVGHKVLSGAKKIEIEKKMVTVRLSVQYMSFSAHADAKGIMQLLRQAAPKNVMLVHGEASKMEFLRQKVMKEFGVNCFMPANGETVVIQTPPTIPVDMSRLLFKHTLESCYSPEAKRTCPSPSVAPVTGVLVMKNESMRMLDSSESTSELGLTPHTVTFSATLTCDEPTHTPSHLLDRLTQVTGKLLPDHVVCCHGNNVELSGTSVTLQITNFEPTPEVLINWSLQDDDLGEFVYSTLRRNLSRLL